MSQYRLQSQHLLASFNALLLRKPHQKRQRRPKQKLLALPRKLKRSLKRKRSRSQSLTADRRRRALAGPTRLKRKSNDERPTLLPKLLAPHPLHKPRILQLISLQLLATAV